MWVGCESKMLFAMSMAALTFMPGQPRPTQLAAHPALRSCRCQELTDDKGEAEAAQPAGVHLGVVCDKTMNPIVGYRYTQRGSNPSYDLCQSEYDKLTPTEKLRFERIEPQVTPRRAMIGVGAAVAFAAVARATLIGPTLPPPVLREDEYDYMELPPLSPAESLVGLIFAPKVPATIRERAPSAPRRVAL